VTHVYVSGLTARASDGQSILGDDEYAQTQVIFGKMRDLLVAAGGVIDVYMAPGHDHFSVIGEIGRAGSPLHDWLLRRPPQTVSVPIQAGRLKANPNPRTRHEHT
jgi:hypothetical protein